MAHILWSTTVNHFNDFSSIPGGSNAFRRTVWLELLLVFYNDIKTLYGPLFAEKFLAPSF